MLLGKNHKVARFVAKCKSFGFPNKYLTENLPSQLGRIYCYPCFNACICQLIAVEAGAEINMGYTCNLQVSSTIWFLTLWSLNWADSFLITPLCCLGKRYQDQNENWFDSQNYDSCEISRWNLYEISLNWSSLSHYFLF